MNRNEALDMWLAEKRKLSPPPTFSERVMACVEQSADSRRPVSKAIPSQSLLSSLHVPHWITTAAVVVCALRATCFLQILIEPTREYSVVADEPIPEVLNVD